MSRSLRGERGGIMVLGAVMIPVFLLLAALVVDAGDWYTHKRQLQNRADAGAFAAGTEYAKNWKACVQTSDPALKLATANRIADAARQYAADAEASDYSSGALPASLYNSEIARSDPDPTKNFVDVTVNSDIANDYADDTDYTDGGAGNVANPCFLHPADDISAAGYWTDVKVKERDLPSLFGKFGQLLSRNQARARVDVRPAISGHRFLPLAIPNNVITQVQVRYYNECDGSLLATRDLYPLPSADQAGFTTAGGGMLWGLQGGTPGEGDKNQSFGLALPAYNASCGTYVPVGMEVRLASRDEIDLNQSCATLIAARYADCFRRLSQIRVFGDGNADSQARLTHVHVTGGCGGTGDAYFSTLPAAGTNCKVDVSAEVDWGTRDDPPNNVAGNFTVSANGSNLTLQSWNTPNGTATYASSGGAITVNPGPNPITISLGWTDTNASHSWGGNACKNGSQNPCTYSATEAAHQAFVGTTGNAGAVALARSAGSWNTVQNLPGSPLDDHRSGGGPADCNSSNTCQIFPVVGTRTVLKSGVLTTLRLDDPQANQSIFCDPDYTQAFPGFQYGCKPWYRANQWTSPWWVPSSGQMGCPNPGDWYSYANLGKGFGVNSSVNAWQCVLTAPGVKTGQVGDYMAVATDNCNVIQNNACQLNSFACNYDGNYDGKSGSTVQRWIDKPDSRYPRVINLFIVPYQSTKGLTGNGDPVPVLGFAAFYVMNWTGSNTQQNDPCPDRTWGSVTVPDPPSGAITGVFVETVDYEPGPVDPHATCVEGQVTPCRVTLVR